LVRVRRMETSRVTILPLRLRFYLLAAETESKLLSGPPNRTEVLRVGIGRERRHRGRRLHRLRARRCEEALHGRPRHARLPLRYRRLASSSRRCIRSPASESPPPSLLVVCGIWIEFVSRAIDLCFDYPSLVVAVKILSI
jgi:hypothetical protein